MSDIKPLYRGFSMRVWPWFDRFLKKVSAITRCPLNNMSAIDRFDCISLLLFHVTSNLIVTNKFCSDQTEGIYKHWNFQKTTFKVGSTAFLCKSRHGSKEKKHGKQKKNKNPKTIDKQKTWFQGMIRENLTL